MKKIKITPENIDELYEKINSYIDTYFDWNVSPYQLKRYLKSGSKGLSNFLNRYDLKNIHRIEKIVEDVIEDRVAIADDNLMTLENFIINNGGVDTDDKFEKILWSGVSPSIQHEKILADYLRTSLGSISAKGRKSIYDVYDLEENINGSYTVFSKEEVDNISKRIKTYIYQYLLNTNCEITTLGINIPLKNVISEDSFYDNYSLNDVISLISLIMNSEFKEEFKGYFIFENE